MLHTCCTALFGTANLFRGAVCFFAAALRLAALCLHNLQLRLRPLFHFPVTLGFKEVCDILIPEKDYGGDETDFFKATFASNGSRKVWDLFWAKLAAYKALAGAAGPGAGAGTAAAAAVPVEQRQQVAEAAAASAPQQ
jgi:hypothetical protein